MDKLHCDICDGIIIRPQQTVYRFKKHWWNMNMRTRYAYEIDDIDICQTCWTKICLLKISYNKHGYDLRFGKEIFSVMRIK